MKRIITSLFILFILLLNNNIVHAEIGDPALSFGPMEQTTQSITRKIPVYLNTNGQEMDSLQIKINFDATVENLDLQVSSQIPIQEISRQINNNSLFIVLTSADPGKTWNTNDNLELLTISFSYQSDQNLSLSFDPNQTLAAGKDSENNILTLGQELLIEGTNNSELKEENPTNNEVQVQAPLAEKNEQPVILYGIIILSGVGAAFSLFYLFKTKQKPQTK